MKFFRPQRVGQLIRDELSGMIMRELEFPLGVLVTVTEVVVSDDIEHAKVKVSVLPGEYEAHVINVLGKFCRHLQHILNRKMNIRPMPQITFELDHGLENAAVVERQLLSQ